MLMSTPVMVPWTTVPFLSSMVTVSWESFIRNLQINSNYRAIIVTENIYASNLNFHRSMASIF